MGFYREKKNLIAILILILLSTLSIFSFAISYVFTPPPDVRAVDHSFIKKDNVYHIFYISTNFSVNGGSWQTDPNEDFFGHSTSIDLINWNHESPVVPVGSEGNWDSKNVWAPYIIQYDGVYYMFYTGVNYSSDTPNINAQKIGVATSIDLYNWVKYQENPVVDCSLFSWTLYNPNIPWSGDCRDPMVYYDLANNKFIMYFFAKRYDGIPVVGIAYSQDLLHWTEGSFISSTLGRRPESPYLLENPYDDMYYLFYSSPSGIEYSISDRPDSNFLGTGYVNDPIQGFAAEVPRINNVIFYTTVGNGAFYGKINLRKLVWDDQLKSLNIADLGNCDINRCGVSSPIFSPTFKAIPYPPVIIESNNEINKKQSIKSS